MMGVFGAIWFSRHLRDVEIEDRPVKVKSLVITVLITAVIFASVFLLSQPMCPKSEQKTIHVPAIKGETEMDSHEAYDYVVCVKQGEKP